MTDGVLGYPRRKKVALVTLGCKINQYDTSVIERDVRCRGHTIVPPGPEADIFIVNTCTVTARTDSKARQMIHKVRGLNSEAVVVVTGCYAQVRPEEIARLGGVDYVFGNAEKRLIADSLEGAHKQAEPRIVVGCPDEDPLATFGGRGAACYSGHTRAFIKIQDGCNESCAYCVIPRARGKSRSLAAERVLEHIACLAESGFKEVVLCGVHVGHYGRDLPSQEGLYGLLQKIEGAGLIQRARISSIEPNELSEDLIDLFAGARHLCPHFHISMQSGDAEVLAAMRRAYRPGDVESLVWRIASRIPEAAVGVDVIVGFPGETERAFDGTMNLIASLPIAYCHVFPYSNRPGTLASRLGAQLDAETIRTRALELRRLGTSKRAAFYRRFLGRLLPVLVERPEGEGSGRCRLKGLSRNYIPVMFEGPASLENREVLVRVVEVSGTTVQGRVEDVACSRGACVVA